MRISRPFFALLAATAIAAGCGKDSNAPDLSHVGHYQLISIDGDPLPITVDDGATLTLTLESGSLNLNAGNTFTQTLDISVEVNGFPAPSEHLSCNGNYSRSGSTITLRTVAGGVGCQEATATGTLSGNTLTVNDQGSTIVFQR